MMSELDKMKAPYIITASNSAKVSFRVPVKSNYTTVHEILIHECNADMINKLKEAGFSLSMCKKRLAVSKY